MAESFAVLCDDEGRVVEALRVGAGLGPIRVGDDLRDHFHASARGKVAALLAALRREGHAFGWELLVALDGEIVPFQVAGAALPEGVLVLAHRSQAELVRLLEDLQGNERAQTCELRRVLDELRGRRASLDDASVFAEMSRLNNELATTQRELIRRSTHLEELVRDKNELLGMVAHDLRNPLTAIFGLAEHLLVDPDHALSASQREAVEHIRASSDHMRNLVEELLDFAAFEAGTITLTCSSTDLVALARRTVRLCRELARAKGVGIELEVVDPDALGLAAVDGPKIAQALVNLITNAIKFSRPGGAIEVRLRRESEGAVFEVEDHGVGIAADELPGLFTAFGPGHTGTSGERSSGLGLAIVRRIVKAHGGNVSVRSDVGVGTIFTLALPSTVASDPSTATGGRAPGRRLEVLIADDDPFCGVVVARLVKDLGHRAELVESVDAAISAARRRRFDVALLDLEMPGGGGVAIAAALRALDRDGARTSLIAVTGHTRDRAASRGGSFDEIVGKPVDLAALRRVLGAPANPRLRLV